MKLEKPIKLSNFQANELKALNNCMLFKTKNYGALICLTDVVIETRIDEVKQRTGLFKSITVYVPTEYLVEIDIAGYSESAQFWGSYSEEAVRWFLSNWNFSKMKADFKNLLITPLQEMGYQITKIEETKDETKCS